MILTQGQGQRSRSNLPQNAWKTKELVISRRLFHLHTSYLVPRYNPIRRIQWPKCRWPWPKVKGQGQILPKNGKKLNNWPYLGCYFTYRLQIRHQSKPSVKVIVTWFIKCTLLGYILVPSMKSVGKIASKIWQVLWFFTHFWGNLTLTFDLRSR